MSLTKKLRPSPAGILAVLALIVALSGTAYAVTTAQVNIADPTTPTQKAAVDATGALKTAGTVSGFVGPAAPKTPFHSFNDLLIGPDNILIGANKSTVALSRIDLYNSYAQLNGAPVDMLLLEVSGTDSTCQGSTSTEFLGAYGATAGQSTDSELATPIILKPVVAGNEWCLVARISLAGNPPSGYVEPQAAASGYVVSGSLPAGTLPNTRRVMTGTTLPPIKK